MFLVLFNEKPEKHSYTCTGKYMLTTSKSHTPKLQLAKPIGDMIRKKEERISEKLSA